MYTYSAKVLKVIDGDTIDCEIQLGFDISHKIRFRLNGIDTPEKTSKDSAIKDKAMQAFTLLKTTIEGKEVTLHSYKPDKYGRYLCDIILKDKNINQMLLEKGLALPYEGGSKEGLWKINEQQT